jgi:hypothetical protein
MNDGAKVSALVGKEEWANKQCSFEVQWLNKRERSNDAKGKD